MPKKIRITTGNPVLRTWTGLNAFLKKSTEEDCQALLQEELNGRCRFTFLKRIHHRINSLRAVRERRELINKALDHEFLKEPKT